MRENLNLPTIDIITPVRNRQFVISYFLDCIKNLDYPKHLISIITILNDSTDNSEQILKQFKQSHQNDYKQIKIITHNLSAPTDSRIGSREEIYKTLYKVRNLLLQHCESEYIFSIDSDILCKPDTLKRLLSAKKDIISALIYNGKTYGSYVNEPEFKYTNVMNKVNGVYKHFSKRHNPEKYFIDEVVQVDMTGAIYLFSNKVAKTVKYGFHKNGEDLAFCQSAQAKGFKLYCNINLWQNHIMDAELLEKYLESKEILDEN